MQIVTSGLVTGLIYMLIALGVTLLFGIMRVVNFVHGELVMLSAFAVYFITSGRQACHSPPRCCAAILASSLAAVFCQYALFRPLQYDILNCFIVGIGASFAIRSASWAFFGPEPIAIPATLPGVLNIGGVFIAKQRLFAAALCSALAVLLYLFLQYARQGKAMRAVEQDREAALLMGIDPASVYVTAFVISAARPWHSTESPCARSRDLALLLYKPKGYLTTYRDPEGRPTVYDLLDDAGSWLAPVGRLDLDTSGLLLLTNDTDFAERVMNPEHKVAKTYLVRASTS